MILKVKLQLMLSVQTNLLFQSIQQFHKVNKKEVHRKQEQHQQPMIQKTNKFNN